MATMNISLPDAMKAWVEHQADAQRYSNASDYVRDLIRRDQARQQSINMLQAAITRGVESGAATPLDVTAFKSRMRRRHAAE